MYTHISTLRCGNLLGVIILPPTHIWMYIFKNIHMYTNKHAHIYAKRNILKIHMITLIVGGYFFWTQKP